MISNKSRLLRLYRYLYVNTDEHHYTTKAQIMDAIRDEGTNYTRQTVRDDIQTLTKEGYDIETVVSSGNYYYYRDRELSLEELKILGDAVSVSPFLGRKEKSALIRKLKRLCSKYQAEMVNRHLVCLEGEADKWVRRIVPMVSDAVNMGSKMSFSLREPVSGDVRTGQTTLLCSPLGIVLEGNRCFLAAIPEEGDSPVLYDTSCFTEPMITKEKAKESPAGFCLETFAKRKRGEENR